MASNYVVSHARRTINLSVNMVLQIAALLFIVGMVLWTVMFTTLPASHDFFHELRHALYLIPCH